MNNITIIGRLTKAPEQATLSTGTTVANFSLAVKDRRGEVTYFNCKAFGKTGELIFKYCAKGSQVGVTGSMKCRKWQAKDGSARESWEVYVDTMTLLGGANTSTTVDESENATTVKPSAIDQLTPVEAEDEMPF